MTPYVRWMVLTALARRAGGSRRARDDPSAQGELREGLHELTEPR